MAEMRTYYREGCVVFRKTKETWGGLSNMAAGFPISISGVQILTSEALYQACRFPHLPDVQELIIAQRSPMAAKMKSKPHRPNSRPDWERIKINVMRWALRAKLIQNWDSFSELLLETDTHAIVEESGKDTFWGARPQADGTLIGHNVLGRLLMELRQEIADGPMSRASVIAPLDVSDFLLFGRPIGQLAAREDALVVGAERQHQVALPVESENHEFVGARYR